MIEFRDRASATFVDAMASDAHVVMAARVSTGAENNEARDVGLINALMRERHGSCFEAAVFKFHIECPIFVAREFQRHRLASYSELSGRYRELRPIFYVPGPDRALVQVGKPMDYRLEQGDEAQQFDVAMITRETAEHAWGSYQSMLARGICREVARMVLPVSTFTEFYATLNARSLMNFLSLRVGDSEAAYPSKPLVEIEHVALDMERTFAQEMPATHEAFVKHGRVAP